LLLSHASSKASAAGREASDIFSVVQNRTASRSEAIHTVPMRSTKELVKELRMLPPQWVDAAIVVAFEDRFEFVSEDHPFPVTRLKSLENKGGLAIGLAGMQPTQDTSETFCAQVFKEYEGQA